VDSSVPDSLGQSLPDIRLGDPDVVKNVDVMVDTVRGLLGAEESRDQSFNGRGVGLAGFVGIIVSLTTTLGRDALKEDLVPGWKVVCLTLFGSALVLLLMTVVVVVRGVLAPRETAHLAYDEVAEYPLPKNVYQPKVMTQGRTLRGLVEVLGVERARGARKARSLHVAYGTLIASLVCIAALGFILGLSDAKVIPHDSGRQAEFKLCLRGRADTRSGRAEPGARELTLRSSCP
jgi:hypothetical protein